MAMSYQLMPGAEVRTKDGDTIGRVKEVRGDYFKVDAAMQPDFWLEMSCVAQAADGEVRLSFDEDHLGEHKLENPVT